MSRRYRVLTIGDVIEFYSRRRKAGATVEEATASTAEFYGILAENVVAVVDDYPSLR